MKTTEENNPQQEMTLEQWMAQLPECHLANRQLKQQLLDTYRAGMRKAAAIEREEWDEHDKWRAERAILTAADNLKELPSPNHSPDATDGTT